ncbi:MAG: hypothetical protein IKL10_06740 [Clostridia bacterium]|nr:hypothetical protein [Clostridia bacterium]
MDTIKFDSKNTKVVAHRGLSGIEKENTNAAFIAAGNRSYFGIETDVHRTLDGKFVCFHDDTTGRVAIDNMIIEETTFDTLRKLLLTDRDGVKGREDLKIPTLKEYISTCKRYEKVAVLELKNEFEKEDIAKICDEIIELDYLQNVIFISFAFNNLVKLRELYPEQKVQFLTSEYTDELPSLLQSHKFDLDILYTQLTEERISLLHKNGIEVNCWICDDKDAGEELARWNIDYITSNILE